MTDDPGSSAARSRAFYRALGRDGLAIRTKPEWDAAMLDALRALIPATGSVLDVGCGYGRVAIPLARLGSDVTGIDIAPNLLRAAGRESRRAGVTIRFDEGSMTALPYPSASFDVAVCLWSAFWELLVEAEQVAALREMARVLRATGTGVIEGPIREPLRDEDVTTGRRFGRGGRFVKDTIAGRALISVAHDVESLQRVAAAAGVRNMEIG